MKRRVGPEKTYSQGEETRGKREGGKEHLVQE